MIKVSIVTVVKNAETTIQRTIESVLKQSYKNIEYIIIDGLSSDQTLNIIKNYGHQISVVISEADIGIYDAMNKGVSQTTGEIVGIISAGDIFANEKIVELIVEKFKSNSLDAVYGNVEYFSPKNINKIIRTYKSDKFKPNLIKNGIIPAHPSLFLKKIIYENNGLYNTSYKIAGDFDFIARIFFDGTVKYFYIPQTIVKMEYGGVSTAGLRSMLIINQEIYRSCQINGIKTSYQRLALRYFKKIIEFIN